MISKCANVFVVQLIFSSLLLLIQCSFTLGLPNGISVTMLSFAHLRFESNNELKYIDGAVVAENWIITEATRVAIYNDLVFKVGIGKVNYNSFDDDIKIINKHCHEKYKTNDPKKYNIALLQTEQNMFGNQIAKLPPRDHHVAHNKNVQYYGFGDFNKQNDPSQEFRSGIVKTRKRKHFHTDIKTNLILKGNIYYSDPGSPLYYFNKHRKELQLVAIIVATFGSDLAEIKYLWATEITHPEIVEFVDRTTEGKVHYGP